MAEKALIINVLAKENYADCHIKGSINVPLDQLEKFAQKLDKNQEIIVYCAHYQCPRSKEAYHLLKKLGFKNAKAYEGGIREWFQSGLPIAGSCQADYLKEPSKKPEKEDPNIKMVSMQELKKKV